MPSRPRRSSRRRHCEAHSRKTLEHRRFESADVSAHDMALPRQRAKGAIAPLRSADATRTSSSPSSRSRSTTAWRDVQRTTAQRPTASGRVARISACRAALIGHRPSADPRCHASSTMSAEPACCRASIDLDAGRTSTAISAPGRRSSAISPAARPPSNASVHQPDLASRMHDLRASRGSCVKPVGRPLKPDPTCAADRPVTISWQSWRTAFEERLLCRFAFSSRARSGRCGGWIRSVEARSCWSARQLGSFRHPRLALLP